jgi:hypothetical protein
VVRLVQILQMKLFPAFIAFPKTFEQSRVILSKIALPHDVETYLLGQILKTANWVIPTEVFETVNIGRSLLFDITS